MTDITGSVGFITGGQRGLGKAFADELLARGAAKVYVTARKPAATEDPRLIPLTLDVTDPDSVRAAAAQATDTTIVINNAGVPGTKPFLASDNDATRAVFETNVLGPLEVARAFAPILQANGGGVLVNIHSVLSWLGGAGAYGASKAALWSATNSLRTELRGQRTTVIGVHLGYADTDMTAALDVPKLDPALVAQRVVAGIEEGAPEVLVDEISRNVKAGLSGPVEALTV